MKRLIQGALFSLVALMVPISSMADNRGEMRIGFSYTLNTGAGNSHPASDKVGFYLGKRINLPGTNRANDIKPLLPLIRYDLDRTGSRELMIYGAPVYSHAPAPFRADSEETELPGGMPEPQYPQAENFYLAVIATAFMFAAISGELKKL